MNATKLLFWTLGALIAVSIALWAYALGPFQASWIEFGYYGQFNQVARIIRAMPELRIEDSWQHHDLTMEDFGFSVVHTDGSSHRIDFWENSPQMKLTNDAGIRSYVESVVAAQSHTNTFSP